ncbi:isocitrate lyase/phosphoenolpyruvate mutase family protein [Streptomyces sp. NPDC060334]|uniref:isocitrate lyase/phosphoenolpyruvate mutase family protein n=1 Tax=unclassified Streptomyces TaxID=2593676 RepID=UPI0003C9EACF|nr:MULTISPECIES: isocitrate lyase/phosphoenolpyruvate mutase family protein [unclassified Streptomyces]AGZ94484.1 PEP mutase [Streptomyces sp. WM4235]KOU42094.1 phosphoenolpyruvate phosphomutase [Streptomyces sp. WM4235]MCX5078167.1 isocitrate lyase/phosphoenolpyruvate mutase family protein [Streptomyces sp. NBC_00424]
MIRNSYPSFRQVLADNPLTKIAGAHSSLGGRIAEQSGFQAVWASSFEISAARCLPDASLLSMTDYLEAAANIQKALSVPVVADCDTGFGNSMNVAYMVAEYESAGITAVSIEDKIFPKMNSFAAADHTLLDVSAFAHKIETAKKAQRTDDFFVIARTEAMISGLGVDEALKRCNAYADAGADAVLVHSKQKTKDQVLEFLAHWDDRLPVVVVPTTYPDWHADDARAAGVSAVIYANQGLRATITSLRSTYRSIYETGHTSHLEDSISGVKDVFDLQQLDEWQQLGA